jgi:hypothetical protein
MNWRRPKKRITTRSRGSIGRNRGRNVDEHICLFDKEYLLCIWQNGKRIKERGMMCSCGKKEVKEKE